MNFNLADVAFGFSAGFVVAWLYFWGNRLIRTRREWYADRLRRGYSVPADWKDE
jgi:hypothetical protein